MKLATILGSIQSLLTDPTERWAILGIVAYVCTLLAVPPDKQQTVLEMLGLLFVAVIGAKGYHAGKLAEGTVPDGAKAAGGAVNINLPAPDVQQQVQAEVQAAQQLANARRQPGAMPTPSVFQTDKSPTGITGANIAPVPPDVQAAIPGIIASIPKAIAPLLLIGALLLTGCNGTQYADGKPPTALDSATALIQTIDQSANVLTAAKQAGFIPASADADIAASLQAAAAAAHAWDQHQADPNAGAYQAAAVAAFQKLAPIVVRYAPKGTK